MQKHPSFACQLTVYEFPLFPVPSKWQKQRWIQTLPWSIFFQALKQLKLSWFVLGAQQHQWPMLTYARKQDFGLKSYDLNWFQKIFRSIILILYKHISNTCKTQLVGKNVAKIRILHESRFQYSDFYMNYL
jgi:hypothetical protein